MATILLQDAQDEIERQLRDFAGGLNQARRSAVQVVQDVAQPVTQAAGNVQQELSNYAAGLSVLPDVAGGAVQQLAQPQGREAIQQTLVDYANQLVQAPPVQPVTQPQQVAGAPEAPTSGVVSLPHTEEPASATDVAPAGGVDNLAGSWKTQFDFGATYTGAYRTGTPHRGVDLVPSNGRGIGTEVQAFTPGTVTLIQRDRGAGGLMVYVQDANGLTHAYMHLAGTAPGLAVGQPVSRGQVIAQMGESGTEGSPHLHYEVRKNAASGDPLNQLIDPRPYMRGGTGGAQQAAPTTPAARAAASTGQDPARAGQGKAGFIESLSGLAQEFSQRTGIDAALLLAIGGHETGWGQSQNAREKNNLFSIQGRSQQGGRWAGYDSPRESFEAFVDLISSAPRYAKAWADRANPGQFIDDLRNAGYVVDEPGFPAQVWVDAVKRIRGEISGDVAAAAPGGPTAVAGAPTPTRPVIAAGETSQPTAKAPIYAGQMMAGEVEQPPGLTLVQDVAGGAQQAVAGAAGAAQQAVGGVQQAAQQRIEDMQRQLDELRATLEQYNQPPLAAGAPARRAIEEAAGGVAGAIAEPGRQIRAALGEPEAGYSELPLGPSPGGGRVLGAGPPAFPAGSIAAQVEAGQRDVRTLTPQEGAEYTAQIMGAGVPGVVDTYRALAQAKREAIEQGNPLREAFFVGGLSSAVADAVVDPVTWILPWGRVANTAANVAIQAGLNPVAGRIGGEALMNGLQNAALEMAQRDATPERVGLAFLMGAGFGGAVRGVQETPLAQQVARDVGQRIMDARGRGWPSLQQFLRDESGELDLDAITRARAAAPEPEQPTVPAAPEAPTARARPAGRQRLPNYEPGTPEAEFEAIARPLRESSPDGLLHLDLNTLPKSVLPLDPTATRSSGTGIVKANPGGAPHTDDLRALFEANTQKRDFYFDQSDQGIPTVGEQNLEEWFSMNSISSMQTHVTGQVSEAIKVMGMVRKLARDGRAEGKSPAEIRSDILKAVNDYPWSGPAGQNKRIGANRGYATGISETGGIKTPTFAGNYGSAESRLYDPGITNDIHNWRAMNVDSSQVPATRGGKQYLDSPHESAAANNKTLYRGVEAIFNELGAEQGVDGYAFQSAVWDGIRAMQDGTPAAWRKWQAGDFKGAIRDAQAAGVFNRAIGRTGAPEPGEISRAMNHPSVKAALAQWGEYLKDPIPPELGITGVSRVYPGELSPKGVPKRGAAPLRPASLAFRQGERAVAEAAAPMVRGVPGDVLERLGVDERGVMPWLAASHRVVEETPGSYAIHLHAGNVDTARYVAAEVGSVLNAPEMRVHYPDYRASDMAGLKFVGDEAEVRRIQDVLAVEGIPTVRGTTGRSLQIPVDAEMQVRIADALERSQVDVGSLQEYTGGNERITADAYPRLLSETGPRFSPTTAGRRGLLERAYGAAAPAEGTPVGGIPGAPGGRAPAQANVPFSLNLGGAALGGYAGYAATPEDAALEERLRNIGLGASAGLLGTRAITGGGPGRLAAAIARRGPPEPRQPFRAPGGPELRATTQEPPGGPGGRPPRTLGEVHSNRYVLREATEGEAALTDEELGTHYDMLERRMEEIQTRSEAIDEMLRNPNQKVQRPPWAAGYTNVQLAEIARRHGVSPYTEYWWEPLGLEAGTGEVRYDVGESGVRSIQTDRELTPTELRREQRLLEQERQDLLAAADQLGSAGPGTRFAPRDAPTGPEGELPFDSGPVIAEGAVENAGPSGNLAEDIVTRNKTTKRPSGLRQLWTEPGQVVGRKEGVIGRGVADADTAGTGEPSVRTAKLMPNLDAMLADDMPEVRVQIQRAVEDNPELFEAYNQGRISHDSLKNDLAKRVGMTLQEWNKTPVGKGFSTPELVALQAAAIDAQRGATDMAIEILNRGGVDNLTPEEVAFGLSNLFDTTRLLAVARGGRATAGRSLNALKIGMDKRLARDITGSNESRAAKREAAAARRGAVRAARLLDKTRDLELEGKQAVANAREAGVPRNIWEQIDEAYAQLDRYQAMSLHEKADDFNRLAKERADRAAARKAKVREVPEELLSALKAELAAERKIFAGRKNTWETMAFWDSKAAEQAAEQRRGFRGGLYIEQQRKAARLAEKANEERARQAWDAQMRSAQRQQQRATTILEAIGGEKPSRDLLRAFTEAVAADDPMVAAKFLKGLSHPRTKFETVVEIARNANVMRLAGMLSSTATHVINSGGNFLNVPLEVGTRAGVVGYDILRSALTGGERQAYAAELLPMLKAWGPGFLSRWGDVKRQLATGISPSELADLSTLRPGFRSGLPGRAGEVIDPAIEMPLRALKASDIAFRGAAFEMQAARVATRQATREGFRGAQRTGRANDIVANLEDWPELYREAAEQAARMVYQERRTVPGLPRGGVYGETEGLGQLAVSQVVPFRFTPANIFAQGFGLSPAGLLGVGEAVGARGRIAARVAAGELPPERLGRQTLLAEERLARATIGAGILGMGLWYGSMRDDQGRPMGKLTAMYDEDEASTYPQGWRAWSMRQDNPATGETVYVPLQNFGAAGVPLAMAALLTDAARRGKKVWEGDELMRAATGLGRYALDNTFLQGVSDWVDLLHDPARSGGKFVEGLVGSYGPYSAMGRQAQRAQGVATRNPREGWLGLLDALEANYPGASAAVPEATTPIGEPRTPGATGLGALVGRYDIERDEPTLRVLRENDVRIPTEVKAVNVGGGWSIELTEAERDQLKRARGAAIRDQVTQLQAEPIWRQATLSERNQLLRRAVSNASQNTNILWLRGLSDADIQTRAKPRSVPEPYILGGAA